MDDTAPTDLATRTALKALADIDVPPPVSWWPETWGWTLLAVVLAVVVAFAVWRWLRHRRLNRYRREALALLARLSGDNTEDAAREISELLKRVALAAWPRIEVASLSGDTWVTFLREHGGGTEIGAEAARLLGDGEYRASNGRDGISNGQVRVLADTAGLWIEKHRVPA